MAIDQRFQNFLSATQIWAWWTPRD